MNMKNKLIIPMLVLALAQAGSAHASNDPVQVDPNTGANFNRYAYANNNPYTIVDPDGRRGELFWTAKNQVTYTVPYVMTGVTPGFTPTQLNDQIAKNFSGTVTINGTEVSVTAQALHVTSPQKGQMVNTVNVVNSTVGVTKSGRSEINKVGGDQITLGATGPEAANEITGSHELGGHGGGAGDQYKGGVDVAGNYLKSSIPGPANIMRDLTGANANKRTLGEIIGAKTNTNKCANGVKAANGGC